MNIETKTTQCVILVMGAPLNPLVNAMLVSAEVDSTMYVPSQFKLVFRGSPDMVLLPGGLQLAVPVVVTANLDGAPMPLITGEISAVEVEFSYGETLTIVRGMDASNRLMRGTKTMAYPEMTASDVVTMLVAEAGIIPGEIIPTTNIYPWLSQANVSNWVFIQQLAALENCVAYADALGLFNFCPMPIPEAGVPPAMTYDLPADRHAAGHGQEPGGIASGRLVGRAGGGGHRHRVRPDPGRAGHRAVALGAVLLAEHRPGHPAPGGARRSSRPRRSSTPASPSTTRGRR